MANGISYLVYYSHPRTKKIPSLFVTADTHVADTLISITFFSLIVFIRIIMAKKKNDEQVWRLIPIVFLHSRLINNNVFVFASSGPGRLVFFFFWCCWRLLTPCGLLCVERLSFNHLINTRDLFLYSFTRLMLQKQKADWL